MFPEVTGCIGAAGGKQREAPVGDAGAVDETRFR